MSRPGPITMTEPPVGMSSKASRRSKSFFGTHRPDAPPICTALASPPPTSLSNSAIVIPKGNSYTPGFSQSPDTLNSLCPVELSVPMLLNQSTPFVEDAGHPRQGLDVVDDRRAVQEARHDRERGTVAAALPGTLRETR